MNKIIAGVQLNSIFEIYDDDDKIRVIDLLVFLINGNYDILLTDDVNV